jgi:transcriptional regulator with XRE-family HTH domain
VRYAATTPGLLRGFRLFNRGKSYRQQVRPFNFMFMLLRDRMADPPSEIPAGTNATKIRSRKLKPGQPRVLAPFNKDIAKVLEQAFDRDTGKTIPTARLKSYIRSIGSYHKHPEAKFENGDWEDFGSTARRLIEATAFHHIGKEAHRWDEQFFLGHDPEARLEYGMTRPDSRKLLTNLRRAVKIHGETVVAQTAEISRQQLSAILKGDSLPTNETLAKLGQATAVLKVIDSEAKAVLVQVRKCCRLVPARRFAELADMDAGQLSRITNGQRALSKTVLARLKKALALCDSNFQAQSHIGQRH